MTASCHFGSPATVPWARTVNPEDPRSPAERFAADRVQEFFMEAQRLERAVEAGLEADGSMILINNVASQSVPHLHLHVIPRRKKDGLRFRLGPRHPYK